MLFLFGNLLLGKIMDYRLKENRREGFIRWFAWSLKHVDCYPAVWLTNYLNRRYEHNTEQKLWFCWLYGNTYNLPTAWVLLNEFPDFELATFDRMEQWNTANYSRLRYQVDTKWNKGHLPVMFASYQKFIGDMSQQDKFESLYRGSQTDNFDNIWETTKSSLHKFGRYSTWFYLQHLKQTADIKIDPTSLMLNDYSGSRSHRNGLLYALGRDEQVNKKLNSKEYEQLEIESQLILAETKQRFPELTSDVDYFNMETCLCSYKKIFRETHSRYLGYYLDRQAGEIHKAQGDEWYGIEWDVIWQSRTETIDARLDKRFYEQNNKQDEKYFLTSFHKEGKLIRMEWMFDDAGPNTVYVD